MYAPRALNTNITVGSRESSPEPSPSKMSKKQAYDDPKPLPTRVARGLSRNARQVAGPSSAAAPVSRSAIPRSHPSSPTVYVEISPRRKTPFPQSATTATPSRAEPTRGRTRDPKAISLPSPSPTAEENSEERPRKRARVPSGPGMSLSEALNRSFAGANATRPPTAGATSISAAPFPTAGPSESISVSLKRKPGRPRGRGRGRGLAHMDPAVSHSALAAATRSSAAGSGAQRVAIDDEEGSAGEDAAPVVPAKRPRGRPRKDSTAPPRPPSRTPSRPRRSVSRRRSSGYVLDAEAMDAQATEDYDTPSQMNLHQSVDVLPVARALEEQAMREGESLSTSTAPPKKPRGRPKGSKNKATLEREALARAAAARAFPANPIVPSPAPAPIKRGPGRPRKSAPNPPTVPLDGTVDYMEPLKDPDEEDVPHPSTLHPGRRTRSRSRARRNSTPAAPSPAYYLDMTTLQWKPRARSVSASPAKRRARVVEGTTEYQTSGRLCAALRQKLLAAPPPRTKEQEKEEREKEKEKDDGFRVSRSGALVLADKDEETQAGTAAEAAAEAETETETQDAPAFVFSGAWEVIADRNAVCDDALLLKTLHDVVKRLGICITYVFIPSLVCPPQVNDPWHMLTLTVLSFSQLWRGRPDIRSLGRRAHGHDRSPVRVSLFAGAAVRVCVFLCGSVVDVPAAGVRGRDDGEHHRAGGGALPG